MTDNSKVDIIHDFVLKKMDMDVFLWSFQDLRSTSQEGHSLSICFLYHTFSLKTF